MKPEPAMTATIDQIAAEPEVAFELAFFGDFWIEVDQDGSVRHIPRPEVRR